MSADVFKITRPATPTIPILLSVPHCGTEFPVELMPQYRRGKIISPDDTDWFVDKLYGFAPEMGITVIAAVYSRWVIDLNRHPESKPLYADGRILTGLCPTTDFLGDPLYQDERNEVSPTDQQYRIEKYYYPYHQAIQDELHALKEKFDHVLLWDCHSIRQSVPTIQSEKFPDLILGDVDGTSASPGVIETALKVLEAGEFSFQHNYPFKGGYITRAYGKPAENIHALQLEMTKVNYLDDGEKIYLPSRAQKVQQLLKNCLGSLHERIFS